MVRKALSTWLASTGSRIPTEEPQHVVLRDADDVVCDQAVRFAVDCLHGLRGGCVGETERGALGGVEPVRQELDAVLGGGAQVQDVGLGDRLGGRAGQVVAVHVERQCSILRYGRVVRGCGRRPHGRVGRPARPTLRRAAVRRRASGGRRASLDLAIAENEHVRDLLFLGLPDLVLHPVVRVVDLDPEPARGEDRGQLAAGLHMPIGDRDDDRLDRGQPERERPGVMLDEDADEPLEAAEIA